MAVSKAPKQWQLTKDETITTFENWRQNLVYTLSLDNNFTPFLTNLQWGKKTAQKPNRDLVDVAEGPNKKTAAQNAIHLDMMLGMIANYCSVITRSTITKKQHPFLISGSKFASTMASSRQVPTSSTSPLSDVITMSGLRTCISVLLLSSRIIY